MPRTNEGVDYLVHLLTSPCSYGSIGSHGPLLFAVSENADPISATDTTLRGALFAGVETGTDGAVAHTSGSSSFTIISPESVVANPHQINKIGIYCDPSPDGSSTPDASLVYEALCSAPVVVNSGDHDVFMVTFTI